MNSSTQILEKRLTPERPRLVSHVWCSKQMRESTIILKYLFTIIFEYSNMSAKDYTRIRLEGSICIFYSFSLQCRYPLAEFRCRFIERLDTRTKVIKKFVSSSFNP